MDKVREIESNFNHGVSIAERKNILVTGVKKIESFDNEEFMMDTTLGFLTIRGNGLEIIKLDTYQGNVSIKGQVDSLTYMDGEVKKDKDNSFISKLFK
ncbi:MAG: sporulation protein YabP [Bacilli bacterium]|nr:sporulation protein YabP [Bacilli bacterium]